MVLLKEVMSENENNDQQAVDKYIIKMQQNQNVKIG